MVAANIPLPREELAEFCRRHHIRVLSLFGSVLRSDFGPESDIDVLYEPEPSARITLLDVVDMRDELHALLGRPIDLVSDWSVRHGRSAARRDAIFSSAQVVYGS